MNIVRWSALLSLAAFVAPANASGPPGGALALALAFPPWRS